jgi:hypothetical protein
LWLFCGCFVAFCGILFPMIIKVFSLVFFEPEGSRYGILPSPPFQYRESVDNLMLDNLQTSFLK